MCQTIPVVVGFGFLEWNSTVEIKCKMAPRRPVYPIPMPCESVIFLFIVGELIDTFRMQMPSFVSGRDQRQISPLAYLILFGIENVIWIL